MRRHPRARTGYPLPGPGADPPRRTASLRSIREGGCPGSVRPPRPRLAIHVGSLPERTRLPRHRQFARLRAGTGRQWLRRAVHPHAEGKPALGADFREYRGTASGFAGIPRDLQHDLADRAPRLPLASPISPEAASNARSGSIGFNPVSQKPRAVHYLMVITQGTLGYSVASLMGPIPAEIFQGRHFGSIFGTIMVAAILGGAAGPWI